MAVYPKGADGFVSGHFVSREFDCPCDLPTCRETLVDSMLAVGLERIREALGVPLIVTSGYRCRAYQDELTRRGYETAPRSKHLDGHAADVTSGKHTGAELERIARECGFESVGVGSNWIHVDTRPGFRRWFYSKRA